MLWKHFPSLSWEIGKRKSDCKSNNLFHENTSWLTCSVCGFRTSCLGSKFSFISFFWQKLKPFCFYDDRLLRHCFLGAFNLGLRLSRLVSSLVLPSPVEQLYMINLHSCTMVVLSACTELALHSYSMLNSAMLGRAMGIMCRDWKKKHNFCIKKWETRQQKQKSEIKDSSVCTGLLAYNWLANL